MSVKIALLGFGTVGKGTYQALTENKNTIFEKTGVEIEIAKILEKNPAAVNCGLAPKILFTQDYVSILNDPEIKIVAEMMGGIEPASEFMLMALRAGKSVVTPNKAAVAANYDRLHLEAERNNVQLRYEASVGGAIPIINTIQDSLVANKITKIQGIVNGTTNYILTKMEEEDLSYEAALTQAQEKGFAEHDPTADVEGIDSANKLSILIAEAFGTYVKPDDIPRTGITGVTKEDIAKAKASNQKIKLIAEAYLDRDGKLVCSVSPQIISDKFMLAQVKYEFNGILISCNMADELFFYGRGAGMYPTGSAVAGDITEIAKWLEGKA